MTRVAFPHLAVLTLALACDAVDDPVDEPGDIDIAHDEDALASELDPAGAVAVAVSNPGF
jgi:hypothetical protein